MAFVNRSDKQIESYKVMTADTVGPGSYIAHQNYNIGKSFVPFNSSSKRQDIIKDKEDFPAPGQYFNNKSSLNEKVVVSSANEDIKIVEIPKPQSIFKSQSQRFDLKKQIIDNPGPGSYEIKNTFDQLKLQGQNQQQHVKKDIIDTLMKINRYQSIPSVPSKLHSFGYTENVNNDLELNKIPQVQHSGLGSDKIGPGQYNLRDSIKDRGTEWHKYQSRDFETHDKLKGLGPGSYETQSKYVPIYKLKQSPGFASTTIRSLEFEKQKSIQNQLLRAKSVKTFNTNGLTNNENEIEEEDYEFVDDSNPAPGQYHNYSTMSSLKIKSKPEKYQFFGSSADRFKSEKPAFQVGPADYNANSIMNIVSSQQKPFKVRNPPFLSSNTRFETRNILEMKPGPGQYKPNGSLEEKLIKKIQKGYKGNFGISEKRFKNNSLVDELPGPGQYIDPIKEEDEQQQEQPLGIFKSGVNRDLFRNRKDLIPPVGAYNIDHFDLKKKLPEFEEEDMDLMVKKPGFLSSEPRFNLEKKVEPINEDEEFQSPDKQNKKLEDIFNKKQKSNVPFNQKSKRFNYEQQLQKLKKVPGPGQYHDPNSNTWNKRTYNILFAEI